MSKLAFARRPSRSDVVLVAAYWLVVIPILLFQYQTDTRWPLVRLGPAVGATVLLDTAAVALLVGGLLPLFLSGRQWRGLVLLPLFMVGSGGAYLGLYSWLFGHKLTSLGGSQLLLGAVAHAKSYGLLAVLLTGKRYFEAQRRVLLLQKTQAESELRALRAQLDPHFLFNNLHVLHTLIGQDAAVAERFLECFANLYRYLLRHREADFVPLAAELAFLHDYVYLLRQRFGAAYEVRIVLAPGLVPEHYFAVPGTLQTLVENAVKHNGGDEDDPLLITLDVQPTHLRVHNPRRPKRTRPEPGGTGLPNLQERYRLLAGQAVHVQPNPTEFVVTVPLLANNHS
jgi:hypothetical protein